MKVDLAEDLRAIQKVAKKLEERWQEDLTCKGGSKPDGG